MKPILIIGLAALTACGTDAALQTAPLPPVTALPAPDTLPPVTALELVEIAVETLPTSPSPEATSPSNAAVVESTPDRGTQIQVATTLAPPPPPSAAEVCNNQQYFAYANGADQPAAICYRAVAAEQGWDAAKIAAWEPFLITQFSGVIQGEASSCWNLRGGDTIAAGENCLNKRSARYPGEDTGWGQATSSLWGRNAVLCLKFGVCSPAAILASPYSSMLNSVIRVVDHSGGSRAWCWTGWAVSYHQCWEAPDR